MRDPAARSPAPKQQSPEDDSTHVPPVQACGSRTLSREAERWLSQVARRLAVRVSDERAEGSAVERLTELGQGLEDRGCSCFVQFICGEAACEDGDALDRGSCGRLAVPGRVADENAGAAARLFLCRKHQVGIGLRGFDVGGCGPGVGDVVCVEEVEIVVHLVLLRRRGEYDAMAAVAEGNEQVSSALEWSHFPDQLQVAVVLGVADGVADSGIPVVADQGGDELVAAHAHVAVDLPERQVDADARECPRLGERVVVVRVYKRSVDVEDRDRPHPWVFAPVRDPLLQGGEHGRGPEVSDGGSIGFRLAKDRLPMWMAGK
jgi:hypothetical protein